MLILFVDYGKTDMDPLEAVLRQVAPKFLGISPIFFSALQDFFIIYFLKEGWLIIKWWIPSMDKTFTIRGGGMRWFQEIRLKLNQ